MKKLLISVAFVALSLPALADQVDCTDVKEHLCLTAPGSGEDCVLDALKVVNSAQHTLSLEFYNFTEPRFGDAVVAAAKRGVKVRAVFDKISPSQKGEQVEKLYDAGVPVWIDHIPAIAHNKTAVADSHLVTGGSFNMSTNADTKNAENLTVRDSECIGQAEEKYISERIAVSTPFAGGGK